jgi:putative spermidine/putrescine transport system ATP-binding protein
VAAQEIAHPALAAGRLSLAEIGKTYGQVTALDGVSLAVEPGELLTILGPSGSGKTTLLKVIAGFELPESGTVRLGGRDLTEAPAASRNIGMVFQNYALFPHMSVHDNIAFPLQMRRTPRSEIATRVQRALELVELPGFAERLPAQLSGGQQQRVALARAIVFQPQLLLLDEPFGALDRKLREAMQLEVRRLQKRLGLTTLFITHDQEEALVLADRIAVMRNGRIEQIGTPEDIYERPRTGFVADFIGESNILTGRITGQEGPCTIVEMAGGRRILVGSKDGATIGREVKVLVRPERIELVAAYTDLNRIAGTILEAIYLGTSHKYRVQIPDGFELLLRTPVRAETTPVAPGDSVTVGFAPNDAHPVDWT